MLSRYNEGMNEEIKPDVTPEDPCFPEPPVPEPFEAEGVAKIKRWGSPCCPTCTIPLVQVMTDEDIKTLRNCFVYVMSTNRTYYIDNEHRFIMCWSGMVFQDNYDADTNPLGLRGQIVPDFANNQVIIYNNTGEKIILSPSGEAVASISDEDWASLWPVYNNV